MLYIQSLDLTANTQDALQRFQDEIDTLSSYQDKVIQCPRKWKNKSSSPALNEVRDTLKSMCLGVERCMYCEDNCGHTVEHIQPKTFYPEKTFIWENFLFVCAKCNSDKGNKHAVFSEDNSIIIQLERKNGVDIVEPTIGAEVFINPRLDYPSEFLELELLGGTFQFIPKYGLTPSDKLRTEHTIDILDLNRDVLTEARKTSYHLYKSVFTDFINTKAKGKKHDFFPDGLRKMNHPTVWYEMKRQNQLIPELKTLFEEEPSALNWQIN